MICFTFSSTAAIVSPRFQVWDYAPAGASLNHCRVLPKITEWDRIH
jgi:hypothetical protein